MSKENATKEDLRWALQRAITLLNKFCSENPEKGTTFKQWVRGEGREMVEIAEETTGVRP